MTNSDSHATCLSRINHEPEFVKLPLLMAERCFQRMTSKDLSGHTCPLSLHLFLPPFLIRPYSTFIFLFSSIPQVYLQPPASLSFSPSSILLLRVHMLRHMACCIGSACSLRRSLFAGSAKVWTVLIAEEKLWISAQTRKRHKEIQRTKQTQLNGGKKRDLNDWVVKWDLFNVVHTAWFLTHWQI